MNSPQETIQAAYAAFGRGDMPALLALTTDDIEWTFEGSSGEPYMRTARGHDDLLRWFGQVASVDGIQVFEPRRFLAGAAHVTVLGWERCQALPGGAVFETPWVHLWELRDGLICRFWGLFDTAAAAQARSTVAA